MGKNITVQEAARLMGKSPQFVRVGLVRNTLPFGIAMKGNGKHYSYYISPKLFYEYTGIWIDDKMDKPEVNE